MSRTVIHVRESIVGFVVGVPKKFALQIEHSECESEQTFSEHQQRRKK